MNNNNNTSLINRNMHFIYDCLAEGSRDKLLTMGFTNEQVARLSSMTLAELFRFSQLSASTNFITAKVDNEICEQIMRRMDHEADDIRLQDELLESGAPTPMMHHFFGLTNQECALRRRELGIVKESGRPRLPDEETQTAIWQAWKHYEDKEEKLRFLSVSKATGESLHTLWSLINKWQAEGALDEDNNYMSANISYQESSSLYQRTAA